MKTQKTKKEKPVYICLAAFGGWTAVYPEKITETSKTRTSLSGSEKNIETILKNHPEFKGVPVFDFSPLALPQDTAPEGFKTYRQAHDLFDKFRLSINATTSNGDLL